MRSRTMAAARSTRRVVLVLGVLAFLVLLTRQVTVGGVPAAVLLALLTGLVALGRVAATGAALVRRLRRGQMVSIVVLARDDEETIAAALETCLDAECPASLLDVVVVNDCSVDSTWQRILEVKERRPELHAVDLGASCGNAAAIVEGIRRARGERVCVVSASAGLDPFPLKELTKPLSDRSIAAVLAPRKGSAEPPYAVVRLDGGLETVPPGALPGASGLAFACRREQVLEQLDRWSLETVLVKPSRPTVLPRGRRVVYALVAPIVAPAELEKPPPRPALVQSLPPGTLAGLEGYSAVDAAAAQPRPRRVDRRLVRRPAVAVLVPAVAVLPVAVYLTLARQEIREAGGIRSQLVAPTVAEPPEVQEPPEAADIDLAASTEVPAATRLVLRTRAEEVPVVFEVAAAPVGETARLDERSKAPAPAHGGGSRGAPEPGQGGAGGSSGGEGPGPAPPGSPGAPPESSPAASTDPGLGTGGSGAGSGGSGAGGSASNEGGGGAPPTEPPPSGSGGPSDGDGQGSGGDTQEPPPGTPPGHGGTPPGQGGTPPGQVGKSNGGGKGK